MKDTIRCSNIEQAFENVPHELRFALKKIGDLFRVALETGHILFGQIEDALHIPHFAWVGMEDSLKSVCLGLRDHAVGLGHLRRQRNDGNREGNRLGRVGHVGTRAET